jgi:hypothetical protein
MSNDGACTGGTQGKRSQSEIELELAIARSEKLIRDMAMREAFEALEDRIADLERLKAHQEQQGFPSDEVNGEITAYRHVSKWLRGRFPLTTPQSGSPHT